MIPIFKGLSKIARPVSNQLFRIRAMAADSVYSPSYSTSKDNVDLEEKLKIDVLNLEELDENLYRGTHLWKPGFARAVYGGQIIGQSLAAAARTIANDNINIHSMHCYFIRPGNPDLPVIYRVNRTRDGASFTSRTVSASQKGRPILTLQASYHNESVEKPIALQHALSYQSTMPNVMHHRELITVPDLLSQMLHVDSSEKTADRVKKFKTVTEEIPIDLKPVDPAVWFRKVAGVEPKSYFWVRARGHIGTDQNLNRCMAAYISDWSLLWTAYVQYPAFRPGMTASLDHSMWFHHPFQADEWMLYECEASIAENCKGLVFGKLYREDGALAITVAQQGLIRPHVSESKL